jgi:hypothetical protein
MHGANMILLIVLMQGANMILLIVLMHGANMKKKKLF